MRIPRRLTLLTSSLSVAAFGLAIAQDRPPVPSKSLPPIGVDGSPTGRIHTSPATRAVFAIRSEPEDSDSDTDDRPEITEAEAIAVAEALGMSSRSVGAAPSAAAPSASVAAGESFNGTARKTAKLSIARATMETFDDLNSLLATLPSKSTMTRHNPPITTRATSNRVVEENRNVRVRCWLYAASKEDDNDYHLILGRSPNRAPPRYMTMELSGLPPSGAVSFPAIKAARDSFNDFFGSDRPGSRYDFYDPPIPVLVDGSLFFDMSHATGSPPGPARLRPNMPTIWEVHPITRIVFEPSP